MARVRFTTHLLRYFPSLPAREGLVVEGRTAAEVLDAVEAAFPGIDDYIREPSGRLRHHVNVFVDGELVRDLATLGDPVGPDTEVFVIQALSGG